MMLLRNRILESSIARQQQTLKQLVMPTIGEEDAQVEVSHCTDADRGILTFFFNSHTSQVLWNLTEKNKLSVAKVKLTGVLKLDMVLLSTKKLAELPITTMKASELNAEFLRAVPNLRILAPNDNTIALQTTIRDMWVVMMI